MKKYNLITIIFISSILALDDSNNALYALTVEPIEAINKTEEFPEDIASESESKLDKKINIHAVDTYLPALLQMIAEQSGYNIVTGPNVNEKDKLTIHIEDVPIKQAINLVVRAAGLSYEIIDESILVATRSKLKEDVGISPEVISLKYSNAEDVADFLRNITEEITIDKAGNKLLINASPKKLTEIEDIISKIDLPATQIMLEAKLIEVTMADDQKSGIDWAKLSQFSVILAETANPLDLGDGAQTGSLLPGSTFDMDENGNVLEVLEALPMGVPDNMYFQRLGTGGPSLSRQLNAFDFTLDLLLKNNKANVLTNSQVVTLNGHTATIKMVEVVPYILSSGGVGGQVQVQRTEVGIKLDIIANVNTDGFITTTVKPEVSSIYDFIGPDRNIPWEKKRTVRSKNNEPIIIGGLLSGVKREVESKFPLLWRIPWIGERFFIHNTEMITKTDLIIQITPTIVDDSYSGIKRNEKHNEVENMFKDEEFGKGLDLFNIKNNKVNEEVLNEEK